MLPTGNVTFLFTDIEGSVPLWEQQPAEMQAAVAQHHAILRRAIETNGGQVFQILGDAFQGAFHLAAEGLCAAVEAQRALEGARWPTSDPVRVRMGLHAGEAQLDPTPGPSGMREYAVSHTLNRAARVMSAGFGGQILLSQEAVSLAANSLPAGIGLEDLGLHRLKGMARLEHIYQVHATGLPHNFPPLASSVAHPHNLPTRVASFIGRQAEIRAIDGRLRSPEIRLLTITGVGGAGKTSLAIQVGQRLLDAFQDGVFLVDLAAIREPQLVIPTIAQALSLHALPGKPVSTVLNEHLARRQMLLILDNFEQVIGAAPEVVQLLAAAPELKIMVTSREPLLVVPEQNYSLSPLPLPGRHRELAYLQNNEAVRLFVERAAAVKPDLVLSADNATAIADICTRLDGLPLAIELIAPHVRLLGPAQLRDRLAGRLRLLASGWRDLPARHQTMRAAISWSFDLLSESEKSLFQSLAVFSGSFSLEAVDEICGDKAFDSLLAAESLLNKHLINLRENDPAPRFWMFETLREYALEQLQTSGEMEALRRKHAAYYAWLVNTKPGQLYSLWEPEIDNLRAAMNWAIDSEEAEIGLNLSRNFFIWEKNVREGRQLIARVLKIPSAQAPTMERATALYGASALSLFQRDITGGLFFVKDLTETCKLVNDPEKSWDAKFMSCMFMIVQGRYEDGIHYLKECQAESRTPLDKAMSSLVLVSADLLRHNLNGAFETVQAAEAIYRTLDNWAQPYLIDCQSLKGFIALEENHPREAESAFRQAFQWALQMNSQQRLGLIYAGLSRVAVLSGDVASAVNWMSLAETIVKKSGYNSRITIDPLIAQYRSELESLIEPPAYQAAWDAAQALSLEQAVAFGEENLTEQ